MAPNSGGGTHGTALRQQYPGAALAMMAGAAFAQGAPMQPTTGSSTTPSTPVPPPAAATPAPTHPKITNYGAGGMQTLPGTSPNIGAGN